MCGFGYSIIINLLIKGQHCPFCISGNPRIVNSLSSFIDFLPKGRHKKCFESNCRFSKLK